MAKSLQLRKEAQRQNSNSRTETWSRSLLSTRASTPFTTSSTMSPPGSTAESSSHSSSINGAYLSPVGGPKALFWKILQRTKQSYILANQKKKGTFKIWNSNMKVEIFLKNASSHLHNSSLLQLFVCKPVLMHYPICSLAIRSSTTMENKCFLHSNGLRLMANITILPSSFPVALASRSVKSRSITVLLIHRAEKVPLQISGLQRWMFCTTSIKMPFMNQQGGFITRQNNY